MRGVEAVETVAGMVQVSLQPANRVRLEAVRDAVKNVGYTPAAARVRVRGKAAAGGEFQVEGLDQTFRLKLDPEMEKRLKAGELVIVEGAVPVPADPRAQLVLEVTAINP